MKFLLQASAFLLAVFATCAAFADSNAKKDWLLDPSGFVAQIEFDEAKKEWRLTNGIIERRIVVEPSAATVSFKNLTTGEELIRAVAPEARRYRRNVVSGRRADRSTGLELLQRRMDSDA